MYRSSIDKAKSFNSEGQQEITTFKRQIITPTTWLSLSSPWPFLMVTTGESLADLVLGKCEPCSKQILKSSLALALSLSHSHTHTHSYPTAWIQGTMELRASLPSPRLQCLEVGGWVGRGWGEGGLTREQAKLCDKVPELVGDTAIPLAQTGKSK